MTNRRSQSGDGKLGCILWLLVVAMGALVAWKAIPVKIASSELYDYMVEQAKWAGNTPSDMLQKRIFNKGSELGLPVDAKQISVEKAGEKVRMRAVFVVPLEFPGYTYEWDFDLQVERPIFIW